MAEHRWSKFWWQDWANDKPLHLCSYAARGLWMDMLCIMSCSDPFGFLKINGVNITISELATLTNGKEKVVANLVEELRSKGVFSVDGSGAIFSRRLCRDKELSDKGRKDKLEGLHGNGASPPSRGPSSGGSSNPPRDPSSLYSEAESEAESDSLNPSPLGEGLDTTEGVSTHPRRRALGTNLRATGENPRSLGTNPRANGTNPRADRGGLRPLRESIGERLRRELGIEDVEIPDDLPPPLQ